MPASNAEDMRQKILREATRLFVTNGYAAISMREIAEACGISKAGLYYHFKDKEDLMVEILTSYLTEMSETFQACTFPNCSAREQLTQVVHAIFAQPPDKRAIIRLVSQEYTHLSQQAQASFNILYQETFLGKFEAILQGGVERGELRPLDPRLTTWLLLGMMVPFFTTSAIHVAPPPDQITATILTLFFNGAAL